MTSFWSVIEQIIFQWHTIVCFLDEHSDLKTYQEKWLAKQVKKVILEEFQRQIDFFALNSYDTDKFLLEMSEDETKKKKKKKKRKKHHKESEDLNPEEPKTERKVELPPMPVEDKEIQPIPKQPEVRPSTAQRKKKKKKNK